MLLCSSTGVTALCDSTSMIVPCGSTRVFVALVMCDMGLRLGLSTHMGTRNVASRPEEMAQWLSTCLLKRTWVQFQAHSLLQFIGSKATDQTHTGAHTFIQGKHLYA